MSWAWDNQEATDQQPQNLNETVHFRGGQTGLLRVEKKAVLYDHNSKERRESRWILQSNPGRWGAIVGRPRTGGGNTPHVFLH